MNAVSPYILTSQRFNQYNFQMYQATLRVPKFPISSYSFLPLYLKQQKWSLDTSATLSRLLDEANALDKKASQFDLKQKNSVINSRMADSSDSQTISVQAQPKAALNTYKIEVSKLAKGQKNTGFQLANDSASAVSSGKNTFRINVGGEEHTIFFYAYSNDTHKETLSRMAGAINQNGIGLRAQVVEDQIQHTSRLELTSDDTGLKTAFSIYDIDGNSVQATGIGNVSQTAEDANYTVNGKSFTSSSNTVTIGTDKDVVVTFHQLTNEAVTVQVRADSNKIVEEVKSLVRQYNQFESYLNHEAGSLSNELRKNWRKLTQEVQPKWNDLGFQSRSDGSLYLDEAKLRENLDEQFDQVQSALSGPGGFATKVAQETERIHETPLVQAYQTTINNNPYHNYLLPNMFLKQAAATGLAFNQLF